MQKSRRPAKPQQPIAEDPDLLAQKISELAIDIVESEDRPQDPRKHKESDLRKLVRKCLTQKKDDVLHDALARADESDGDAFDLLKETVEESSGVILVRNDKDVLLELNAFAIPLFVHSTGGLDLDECFQDEEAFELLIKSFTGAGLESPDAAVVLVSHAYHPAEFDRIGYSQLNQMAHEAYQSMTRKKLTTTSAIDGSIAGWPQKPFGPEDHAVELRFLLGFALKEADDGFYRVPANEKAADAYFARREERFRRWSEQYAPLVRRCLTTGARPLELNFLYQDLFHGARERGMREFHLLQMMAELNRGLQESGMDAAGCKALIAPAEGEDGPLLRVSLFRPEGAMLVSADKPVTSERDLDFDIEDVRDALTTLGIGEIGLDSER